MHRSGVQGGKERPVNFCRALVILFILIFFPVISTQILNFERSLSLSPEPQSNLVPSCKISLGGPDQKYV
jgi:hypothetical protein